MIKSSTEWGTVNMVRDAMVRDVDSVNTVGDSVKLILAKLG